jgi:hypothetical protein
MYKVYKDCLCKFKSIRLKKCKEVFLILNNIISLLRVKYTKYFITFVNNKIYLLKRLARLRN